MVTSDFHIHSDVSFDARSSMADLCREAIRIGLKEICITDHHDIYSKDFCLNIPLYLQRLKAAREEFGRQIAIRSGLEAGDSPETRADMQKDIRLLSPDYVLLSTHEVDGIDPYFADRYYANRTREQGLHAYLEAVLDAVENMPDYDAVAHIGYAARYAPKGQTPSPLACSDAPELLDRIFTALMTRDKALEVNTSKQEPTPGWDIIERYYALGGRRIVLGSDAHSIDWLAHNFAQTEQRLKEIGFTHYCTFEGRRRYEMPFDF